MQTVLRNVRRFTAEGRTVDVRYEGQKITTVTPTGAVPDTHEDVIEAHGRLACPGFINAHTHLAMVLFRGLAEDVPLHSWLEDHIWPLEKRLTPKDVYWCTLLAIAEGIRSGTVAFVDMYLHVDEVARAVEESGVRAILSDGIIASSLADRGLEQLERTQGLIDRWNGQADGRIRVAPSYHAVYTCGEDVIRETVGLAQESGTLIHTHIAETRREVEECKASTGRTPVRYLDDLGAFSVPTVAAHCVHVDADDIALLADRPVTVVHCPKSNAKLGSGIAPVVAMRNAGIPVALGTDGAASNNRLDMVEELRAAWILQRAFHEDSMLLPSRAVIEMAVSPGREAFGLPREGLIEGAPADIVLIDTDRTHTTPIGDPAATLAFASGSSDVTDVIVDGRCLMKNGVLLTIDEERVQSEVNRLLRRLNH